MVKLNPYEKSSRLSPTYRSIGYLEEGGWLVDIVERKVTKLVTHDLFGMFDLVAIRGPHTLAVQVTSDNGGNMAARRRKLESNPDLKRVLKAGWHVEVHGWRKATKRPGYQLRVMDDLEYSPPSDS